MSDYRVGVKVRNALLLRAIEQRGHKPGVKFAALAGVSYPHLVRYVNLTRVPYTEDGMLRPCAERLCLFLNRMPCDLWSEEQLYPLDTNAAEFEVSGEEVRRLFLFADDTTDPVASLERSEATRLLDSVMSGLTPREAEVLRMRNGLEGDEMTLNQTAKILGLSAARVKQIAAKALRKLRNPERQKILKEIAR